jgi:hypothetical protein
VPDFRRSIIILWFWVGYANEVGEAFRALIHRNYVRLSYGIAFAYVLADTHDKTKNIQDNVRQDTSNSFIIYHSPHSLGLTELIPVLL